MNFEQAKAIYEETTDDFEQTARVLEKTTGD
jgi:hypothetical protein